MDVLLPARIMLFHVRVDVTPGCGTMPHQTFALFGVLFPRVFVLLPKRCYLSLFNVFHTTALDAFSELRGICKTSL